MCQKLEEWASATGYNAADGHVGGGEGAEAGGLISHRRTAGGQATQRPEVPGYLQNCGQYNGLRCDLGRHTVGDLLLLLGGRRELGARIKMAVKVAVKKAGKLLCRWDAEDSRVQKTMAILHLSSSHHRAMLFIVNPGRVITCTTRVEVTVTAGRALNMQGNLPLD